MTSSNPTISHNSQELDEARDACLLLSSPLSTPLTTSPELVSIQSLADQNPTPLSMMDDSCFLDIDKCISTGLEAGSVSAPASVGKTTSPSNQSSSNSVGLPAATNKDPSTHTQRSADLPGRKETADDGNAEPTRAADDDNVLYSIEKDSNSQSISDGQSSDKSLEIIQPGQSKNGASQAQPKVISPSALNTTGLSAQNSNAPSNAADPALGLRGHHSDQHEYQIDSSTKSKQYETASAPTGLSYVGALPARGTATAPAQTNSHCTATQGATRAMSSTTSSTSNSSVPPGHQRHRNDHSSHDNGLPPSNNTSLSSRLSGIKLDTSFIRPTPRPIVRTAPDSPSLNIKHPTPDITSQARSGAYVGNIAQLEATAERLSMTSSIDDAIRDLHTELKRSDSRRSSILAASLKASGSIDDYTNNPGSAVEQLRRHPSIASSIVSTNNAARHGGYSPAGYVLSPNHSFTGRLRSGSKNSAGRPDFDLDSVLSRHGPGKASVRSVRSTKVSLAEISESEPIALTQDVLDMADKTPAKSHEGESLLPEELRDANMPATDVFQNMMGDDDFMESKNQHQHADANTGHQESRDPQRPGSSHSDTTFQQCQDAFGDFDGVHWVPDQDDPYAPPEDVEPKPQHQAAHRPAPRPDIRPQSYMDPESGQQMLYYPARVPAMLNLPPKLSNKPKANERNKRRSQVMSAMFDGGRKSQVLDAPAPERDTTRDSWLPDPLAGHRASFVALTSDELRELGQQPDPARSMHSDHDAAPAVQPEVTANSSVETLRRPQKLSRKNPDERKSRMSNLPPQLRASAYFDLPDNTQPDIEVKDGSAMATLESILDASANAPVSAFTDHERAGRLGKEVYGKEKKRASVAASVALQPEPEKKHARKRSSFMWLGKRHSHVSDDNKDQKAQSESGLGPANADTNADENDGLARSVDGRGDGHSDDEQAAREDAEDASEEEEGYHGPPTTLLAELQLRKQQQKERTQRTFPGGMHATLLEMDAVAETQKKARNTKRINLAWEEGQAQPVDEDSDDEDIPLAVIAARNQGAKNVMDLNRPIGLMERREMEENEPLSHRRARLHGQDPRSMVITNRPSMNNLSANYLPTTPHSVAQHSVQNASTEPDDEFEGETLADRKKRLAAKEEAENLLPKARAVSGAFSIELLNQFEDPEEKKKKEEEENKPKSGEEETLGQRRRRLQAEREAREREMSFNQLNASSEEPPVPIPGVNGQMHQMSSVLSAHPKRSVNEAMAERERLERERRLVREGDARMAAYRNQMPQALGVAGNAHSGGYRGGTFNNGLGGQNSQAAMSSPALHTQLFNQPALNHRKSAVFSTYGAPMQPAAYGAGGMSVYGGNMMQPGMQMPGQAGPSNRIEQWRQGVLP